VSDSEKQSSSFWEIAAFGLLLAGAAFAVVFFLHERERREVIQGQQRSTNWVVEAARVDAIKERRRNSGFQLPLIRYLNGPSELLVVLSNDSQNRIIFQNGDRIRTIDGNSTNDALITELVAKLQRELLHGEWLNLLLTNAGSRTNVYFVRSDPAGEIRAKAQPNQRE